MKKQKFLATATAILGILSLVCLFAYFLALSDIFQDYASPKVLQEHAGLTAGSLPDWTECPLEWLVIGIGFWPMVAFHLLFMVSLFLQAAARIRELPNNAPEATS